MGEDRKFGWRFRKAIRGKGILSAIPSPLVFGNPLGAATEAAIAIYGKKGKKKKGDNIGVMSNGAPNMKTM
jgi:hypothetical protein